MSDEKDSPTPALTPELLDRLEATNRRLEQAHADYLEAAAESRRALTQMVQTFTELSDTIRQVHSASIDTSEKQEAIEEAIEEATDDKTQQQEPVKIFKDDQDRDASAPTPSDVDQSQNALPAHLHSRGVVIPDQQIDSGDELPAPRRRTSPARSGRMATSPGLASPRLAEAFSDEPRPFSGIGKQQRIILTNDGFGVAPALNDILSREGLKVRVDSRRPELSAPADTVIFLGGLRAPSNLDDAMSIIDDAVYTAHRMTTRLMQPDSAFLAAIDTGGGFGLDPFDPVAAPLGALLGLVRLLDRRHPGAYTKLIDFDGGKLSAQQIAERLATELLEGGDTTPVTLDYERRRTVQWEPFDHRTGPASWLEDEKPPLVYMPGPDAVLSTAVERMAIAHELPVALLRRRHTPGRLARNFGEAGIHVRAADYELNRLFSVMDFLDAVRDDFGPIAAIVTESMSTRDPDKLVSWDAMRSPLDEFNALLAMTINDPLRLLGVGIGPGTPPIISSALRYFARAESLRRNDHLQVRLAHMQKNARRNGDALDPCDFALTAFLAGSTPQIAEVRFRDQGKRGT